jgi:sulfite reductase (NADPH) flavoprotein alpha-component
VATRSLNSSAPLAKFPPLRSPICILYATVSGNAERLAHETARRLEAHEVAVRDLGSVAVEELATIETALFIVSTWGDGEPPPESAEFFKSVSASKAPNLGQLSYAVLALGSSRYPDFCGCGRRLDEDLARLGARRLLPRADCDVKMKATFEDWLRRVAEAINRR